MFENWFPYSFPFLTFGAAEIVPLVRVIHIAVEIPLMGPVRIASESPVPSVDIFHHGLSLAPLVAHIHPHGARQILIVPELSFLGIEKGFARASDESEDESAGFGREVMRMDSIGVVEFDEFIGGVGDCGGGHRREGVGWRGEAEDGVEVFGRLQEGEGVGAEGGDAGFAGCEGGGAGID